LRIVGWIHGFKEPNLLVILYIFKKILLSKVNGIQVIPPPKKETYFLCKQYKSEDEQMKVHDFTFDI